MIQENETPKVMIGRTISKESQYDSHILNLQTSSGKPFVLEVVNGHMSLDEILRKAYTEVVLTIENIAITTDKGTFFSNEAIPVLQVHGMRDQQGVHTVLGGLNSFEVVQAIVKDREQKQQPRIKLFISCDDPQGGGVKSRWDQGTLGNELGVVGFSGDTNYVSSFVENGKRWLQVKVQEEMGPHPFKPDSRNTWLINGLFTFKPNGGKIIVK